MPLAAFFAALLAPLSSCDALLRRRLARLAGAVDACSTSDAAWLSLLAILVGIVCPAQGGLVVASSAHRGLETQGSVVVVVVGAVVVDVLLLVVLDVLVVVG